MHIRQFIAFALLHMVFACGPAWGQFVPQNLSLHVDREGDKTIDHVAKLPDAEFTPRPAGLSEGYARPTFWLRFTAEAPQGGSGEWWVEIHPPYLEDVRFYEADPARPGEFLERRAGALLPFAQRESPYRGFLFKIRLEEGTPKQLYLRIQSNSTALAMIKLWPAERLEASIPLEYVLQGAFFGLIAILLIINLISWASFREPIYPVFLLYMLAVVISSLSVQGLAGQFLFPDQPALNSALRCYSTLLLISASGLLYRNILLVGPRQRLLFWLYRMGIILPLASLPLVTMGYFVEVMRAISPYALLMTLVSFYRCIQIYRQRTTGGGLMTVAVIFSIAGLFLTAAQISGFFPGNFVVMHALQVSLLGNVVALHLAVVVRIKENETERQQALQEAHDANVRAEREMVARNEQTSFVSTLAHELKTPLAGIGNALDNLEILLGQVSPEIALRIDRIRRSARRIDGIATRYREVDRDDNTLLELTKTAVKLSAVLETVLHQCPGERERLVIPPHDDIPVCVDRGLFAAAIVNLIDNAMKYSPADQPVELSVNILPGKQLNIDVADHGPGVRPEMRSHIFQRYVRAQEQGDISGIGVGLALVDRIMVAHGGSVELIDRSGGGSIFRLTLPLPPAPEIVRN